MLTAPESAPAATSSPSGDVAREVVRSPPLSCHVCTQQRRRTSQTRMEEALAVCRKAPSWEKRMH